MVNKSETKMSTTTSKKNKFSIKFNKKVVSANANPKTDGTEQGTQNTHDVQSVSDDVLTR